MGLRLDDLGTVRLTWADLRDVLTHLPMDAALYRSQMPHGLSMSDLLLSQVEHTLRILAWQQTKDAASPTPQNRPEPLIKIGEDKKHGPQPDEVELSELRRLIPMR